MNNRMIFFTFAVFVSLTSCKSSNENGSPDNFSYVSCMASIGLMVDLNDTIYLDDLSCATINIDSEKYEIENIYLECECEETIIPGVTEDKYQGKILRDCRKRLEKKEQGHMYCYKPVEVRTFADNLIILLSDKNDNYYVGTTTIVQHAIEKESE